MNSVNARLLSVFAATALGGVLLTEVSENHHYSSEIDSDFPDGIAPPDLSASIAPSAVKTLDFSLPEGSVGWDSLQEMHAVYTQAFVESEGFGMGRLITFESPEYRPLFVDGEPHRMESMELLSLMQGDAVAYDSTWINITRSGLDIEQQRPLTEFETDSLRLLKAGRPHVWSEVSYVLDGNTEKSLNLSADASELQMANPRNQPQRTLVAALRAQRSCLSCHDVAEGALLGAFVYQLHRSPKIANMIGRGELSAKR